MVVKMKDEIECSEEETKYVLSSDGAEENLSKCLDADISTFATSLDRELTDEEETAFLRSIPGMEESLIAGREEDCEYFDHLDW